MRVSSWLYLLEQTLSGVCLLCAIGRCAGLKHMHPCRSGVTSALLALMAMLCAGRTPWLRLLPLALSAAAPIIAWPDAPRRIRPRLAALSLFTSVWLTGLLRFMHPLALPGLIALLAGCTALFTLPRFLQRCNDAPPITSIEVRIGPRRLTLTALIDSGNLLRDVITGLPVIVISRRAAARVLSLPPDGTLLPGMRLMSIRTVSGTGMMTILRPDGLRLLSGQSWLEADALIGLSPDGYEGFQALLPASLLPDSIACTHQAISQGG